jgi:G3E family GTPase
VLPRDSTLISLTAFCLQNKWEHISTRALDLVVDHLNTLNDLTPKINCKGRSGVDPNLIFGVDSKLFLDAGSQGNNNMTHTDEVETLTIYGGPSKDLPHAHEHEHHSTAENSENGQGGEATGNETDEGDIIDIEDFTKALDGISKESVWRVKGFVRLNEGVHILNWAFGRFDLMKVEGEMTGSVRFTVMGERGEVRRASRKFAAVIHADVL